MNTLVLAIAVAMVVRSLAASRLERWKIGTPLVMVLAGGIVGVAGVFVLTRYIESLLFGVKAIDPPTLAATGLLLLALTALAGFLPARRATRVEPVTALRHE